MTNHTRLRILFAGTPDFAVPALQSLIEQGFPPIAVLTQPDRPAGRGRQLQFSPVKQLAIAAGIPVHQPITLRDSTARDLVAELGLDLMIVAAYGLILPGEILREPAHGCWNIHASLLPRWRGAAPVQRAIESGDRETGVCIMQMDEGLDTGPVIRRASIPISSDDTGGSLHDSLAKLGATELLHCVLKLDKGGPLPAEAQSGKGICYAAKLRKSEARVDWTEPAEVLERRIRAFNPWPVAWCMIGGERTRIWKSSLLTEHEEIAPGTVLSASRQGIDVATGRQVLRLLELQRPGKRRMSSADYLNAKSLPVRLDND